MKVITFIVSRMLSLLALCRYSYGVWMDPPNPYFDEKPQHSHSRSFLWPYSKLGRKSHVFSEVPVKADVSVAAPKE